MAGTVTSQLTRIEDCEAGTLSSIGGGAGATTNTDVFIQGATSFARRQSSQTDHGFWFDNGSGIDLSAASVHVGYWIWHTHFAVLTKLAVRVGTSTTNYDEHTIPLTEYPNTGGWIRVWFDISRTPTATGGSGLNEAAAQFYALLASLPAVGGSSQNLVMDAVDYTTGGLLVDSGTGGSPAVFDDFETADGANTTNKYGVMISRSGIRYVLARLTIGDATATVFNDSNETLIFLDQSLVESTFMGLSFGMSNASTDIDLASCTVRSAGATKGDLLVTGTSGTMNLTSCTLASLRVITLTSVCTLTTCVIQLCGLITQSNAIIDGCTIDQSTGAVGVLSDNPQDISDCVFISDGTGHAIEISATGTYTFSGNTFSGYAATNGSTGNEAIYNNSGGAVTLNISGGGGTPTIRNGAGASTTVNNNISVTLTGLKDNTEVRVFTTGTTTALAGIEDATDGSADNRSFTFSLSAGTDVDIQILSVGYENLRLEAYEVPTSDTSVPIQQRFDRNYNNP